MGIRTPDLLNAIEALYQLSYDPAKRSGKSNPTQRHVKVRAIVNPRPTDRPAAPEPAHVAQNYIETRRKLS